GGTSHRVKLVDFGIALEIRSAEDRTHYHSPGYSAPEMKESRPVDHRADLYSLGALWYALLVGEAPVFMFGAERLIQFTLNEALKAQKQVPMALGGMIARLLASSPEKRYISANEVIEAVNEITGSTYQLETRETASSYALRTRFVNREAEMEVLQTVWEQAKFGEGRLVLISGASGLGKTRLVEELEIRAELEGARVVWGQCVESGCSAYQPWREVLRVLIRYVEGVGLSQKVALDTSRVGPVLAAILPELWERDYMTGLTPPAELDPQAARQRLHSAIVQTLRAAAKLRPTMVVIENAQWADEATLAMLGSLTRTVGQTGLLVCVTYRSDEIGTAHPLVGLTGDQVLRIPTQMLLPKYTTELVCSMLGLEELPALLMERVQQTTGGNAFFVQELIRSLAAEGKVLRRTVEGWQVDGDVLRVAQLPESIRQVVERRLPQLSEDARQVLAWAAVTGLVFWEGGVVDVGQVSRAWVQARLGELVDLGLIMERDETSIVGEREYLFFNPTVREVSYESISQEERQKVHGRMAEWLMAHSDEKVSEHLGLIADHLERAGKVEEAVIYLQWAGEQATSQFANAEVAGYLSRALCLTPQDDRERRYLLLLNREKIYDYQGDREAQQQDLTVLRGLAYSLADNTRKAEVALQQARYADVTSDYPAAIAAAREAIQFAQAIQNINLEATGHFEWGIGLFRQGDYQAARTRLEQVLILARKGGNQDVEAQSLHYLGQVFWAWGQYNQAEAYAKQALDLCREIGHRVGESDALNTLGMIFGECGDYLASKNYYEQSLQITREIGHRKNESRLLLNLGNSFLLWGDYAEAQRLTKEAVPIKLEIGDMMGWAIAQSNLAWLFHLMGDNRAAREESAHILRVTQRIGDRRNQGFSLTVLGYALEGLGQLEGAADFYQQAIDLRREIGQHHLVIESLAGLARVSLAQGKLDLSLAQVEEILTYLEDNSLDGTEEPMRIYLTCYRVLQANDDLCARSVLETAYQALQEQATAITDQEIRRSFLENVLYHREIVREFARGEFDKGE
ncbi:MAG: tetratricopeptide repeat protein, partial [Chloroflexi bacterium]|nr:tetratricopeptide repeat protein [Chloroflexota bacterium]